MDKLLKFVSSYILEPLDEFVEYLANRSVYWSDYFKPIFDFFTKIDKWLTLNFPILGINHALTHAANFGYTDIVDKLLERGANVMHESWTYDCNALEAACSREHIEITKKLLAKMKEGQKIEKPERLISIIRNNGNAELYEIFKPYIDFPADFVLVRRNWKDRCNSIRYKDESYLLHLGARHDYLESNEALDGGIPKYSLRNIRNLVDDIKKMEDIANGETRGRRTLKTILPVVSQALTNVTTTEIFRMAKHSNYKKQCHNLNHTDNKYCVIATGSIEHASYLVVKKLKETGAYQVQFCDRGPFAIRESVNKNSLIVPTLKLNQKELDDVIDKALNNEHIPNEKVDKKLYGDSKTTIFGYRFDGVKIQAKPYKRGTCSVSNLKTAIHVIMHNEMEDMGKTEEARHVYKLFSFKLRIVGVNKYEKSKVSGEKGERKEKIVKDERKRITTKEKKWSDEEERRASSVPRRG